jgi:hypothetical protein
MQVRRILPAIAGVAVLAAALGANAGAQSGTGGLRASAMPTQTLAIAIHLTGSASHGEHVTLPTFAVEPGLPVHVTFTNYTHKVHTFTVPALGISAVIGAAHGTTPGKTVVTFTAHAHGAFDWHCLLCPVQGGANSEVMKGKIYAIVQV